MRTLKRSACREHSSLVGGKISLEIGHMLEHASCYTGHILPTALPPRLAFVRPFPSTYLLTPFPTSHTPFFSPSGPASCNRSLQAEDRCSRS